MTYRIRNRWIVTIAAISVQLAIGALYAWSLFNDPISEAYGVIRNDVVFTYSICLSSFSLAMLVSGRVQQKIGPRYTTLIGGLLYTSGILLSSFATSPYMLYLTYGVMAGSGVAFVYVCPLSTLVKWFPNNKGLITGVATGAFAIGGFVFKLVIGEMFNIGDAAYTPELVSSVFLTLAIIYGVLTIGGALLLDVPENPLPIRKDCKPQNWDHQPSDVIKTSNFYKLFISDLLALMPGLLVIGLAKDIGSEYANMSYGLAAWIVAIIAIVNAIGRIMSGLYSDKLGALNVYKGMYFITILSLATLAFVPLNQVIFLIAILGIAVGYGSFLSLVPTIVGRLFGGQFFSSNYPLVFLAYGFAAWIGPLIVRLNTNGVTEKVNYSAIFAVAMVTAIGGLIVASLIKDINEEEIEVVCD